MRQAIDLNPVTYRVEPNNIGYIRIVDFAETTSEKFNEA